MQIDMKKCGTCKYWKGTGEARDCEHPKVIADGLPDKIVLYGADDDYGSYFRTDKGFGCILHEESI